MVIGVIYRILSASGFSPLCDENLLCQILCDLPVDFFHHFINTSGFQLLLQFCKTLFGIHHTLFQRHLVLIAYTLQCRDLSSNGDPDSGQSLPVRGICRLYHIPLSIHRHGDHHSLNPDPTSPRQIPYQGSSD